MATESDTRIRKDAAAEVRGSRSVTADAERTKDASGVSAEERARLLRDEFKQEALPTAPVIPGWHVCWLASNNNYDPIHKRMRLGYQPVMVEEVPSMSGYRMTTGDYAGVVACNEMLLFKVPQEAYEQIMREYHHDAPLREEEGLRAQLVRGEKDSQGHELGQVEGFEDLAQRRPAPHQFA